MIGYDPSYLNETETLLEEFHKIQKYLFENPIYKIYQANVDYVTNVNEYYTTDVVIRSGDTLGVGDVVLFRNVYYGVITEINEDTQMFTIAEGISFRGATGARGLRGEIGATGATGATGANGLEYLGAVVQIEYDGDEFDEPLTFNNSDFNRTPTINDGFLFMYHLNESNLSYIVNGRVTAVGTDTCRVTISPQARQEVTGPVGPAGPIGPVGANGLSIYLYDGEITSTTTTATIAQVEVPTGRTLQVYDILFSTYETTYGAMAEVTEIHDTGLRVDYIGQVASAGGGGTTLQRFTTTITLNTSLVNDAIKNAWKLLSAILRTAKGKVTITSGANISGAGCFSIEQPNDEVKIRLFQGLYGTSWQTENQTIMIETNRFGSEVKLGKFVDNWSDGTFRRTYSSPSSTGVKIQYWNDTEITI